QMFSFTSLGYMFIVVLPLRMGELIIPFLIKKNTRISLSSSLIVIMVERLLDLFVVLLSLLYIISILVLPEWVIKSNLIVLIAFLLMTIIFIFSYNHSNLIWKMLLPILRLFKEETTEKVKHAFKGFREGLKLIKSWKNFAIIFSLSIVIICLSISSIYYVLQMLDIESNLIIAATILIINLLGISIPGGPAMAGNFQYSCMLALSFFSINKGTSFIFANLYYVLGIGFTILLGIIFIPKLHFSWNDMKKVLHASKEQV
ncbi:MAG: lysylphosphatidylglycerol synthase transmembrane domain-containing protein, partial [Spirochaetota bacterium]